MFMAVEPLQLVHLVLDFLDPGIHLALEFLDPGIQPWGLFRLLLDVPVALRLIVEPRELSLELPDALTTLTIML